MSRSRLPLLAAVVTTACCLAGIALCFWWFDWRVSAPTPVPPGHVALQTGARVVLPPALAALAVDDAPVLVHFYNPDCPCSRFNKEQLLELHAKWGTKVRFIVVAETTKPHVDSPLGNDAPLLLDPESELADALAVYSTPQAVLLGADRSLVYAGNYNTSRYCTDPHTEFVRLALERLAEDGPPLAQLPAWGCQLPAHVARAEVTP
ncbi:MAG: hypothetical protein QM817_26110 [Archangium sp.]